MQIDRRSFIRSAAMAAATTAALRPTRDANALPLPVLNEPGGVTWSKAPCRFCGTGCAASGVHVPKTIHRATSTCGRHVQALVG